MTDSLTITLDPNAAAWLTRQSNADHTNPTAFVESLLRELADPDQVEGDLIDRLLAQAVDYFPAVMTLDEQDERRDEVLDHLCGRIATAFRHQIGEPLTGAEQQALRGRLVERSHVVWPTG